MIWLDRSPSKGLAGGNWDLDGSSRLATFGFTILRRHILFGGGVGWDGMDDRMGREGGDGFCFGRGEGGGRGFYVWHDLDLTRERGTELLSEDC